MEHWSKYWQTHGVLNSFAEGSANSGYTGELKKFWEDKLKVLPQQSAIVDLGTGNGALALLALDYGKAHQQDFTVHGLDAAKIAPAKQFAASPAIAKKLKSITFHSETPIEEMPFNKGSVNAFVAQFAIEYADRDKALQAIVSALNEGGQLIAVMHHNESKLVKDSKLGLSVLNAILEDSPLFQQSDMLLDLAGQAIPQIGAEAWADYPHNQILTRSIQWTMSMLQAKFAKPAEVKYVNDVVRRIARIFEVMNAGNLEKCKRQLAFEYHVLNDYRLRLQDQLNAALTKKNANDYVKTAEKLGVAAQLDILKLEDSPFGWVLTLTK